MFSFSFWKIINVSKKKLNIIIHKINKRIINNKIIIWLYKNFKKNIKNEQPFWKLIFIQ